MAARTPNHITTLTMTTTSITVLPSTITTSVSVIASLITTTHTTTSITNLANAHH